MSALTPGELAALEAQAAATDAAAAAVPCPCCARPGYPDFAPYCCSACEAGVCGHPPTARGATVELVELETHNVILGDLSEPPARRMAPIWVEAHRTPVMLRVAATRRPLARFARDGTTSPPVPGLPPCPACHGPVAWPDYAPYCNGTCRFRGLTGDDA